MAKKTQQLREPRHYLIVFIEKKVTDTNPRDELRKTLLEKYGKATSKGELHTGISDGPIPPYKWWEDEFLEPLTRMHRVSARDPDDAMEQFERAHPEYYDGNNGPKDHFKILRIDDESLGAAA